MTPRNLAAFGAAVRERRISYGLTQRELAARCGCDFTTISKIEHGALSFGPSALLILRLADTLQVSALGWLSITGKAVPITAETANYLVADLRRLTTALTTLWETAQTLPVSTVAPLSDATRAAEAALTIAEHLAERMNDPKEERHE